MKKLIYSLLLLLFLTGCSLTKMETPREKVEEWLMSYQKNENPLKEELEEYLEGEDFKENKEKYKTLLEKQYNNFSYKILEEEIEEDEAEVEAEIEVLDYASAIKKAKEEFDSEEGVVEETKEFIERQIDALTKVEEKTKYQVTFYLEKEENEWVIKDLDQDTFLKMYGLY